MIVYFCRIDTCFILIGLFSVSIRLLLLSFPWPCSLLDNGKRSERQGEKEGEKKEVEVIVNKTCWW